MPRHKAIKESDPDIQMIRPGTLNNYDAYAEGSNGKGGQEA